jgi:hypothetical protein
MLPLGGFATAVKRMKTAIKIAAKRAFPRLILDCISFIG